jgi:hypothetical protein
MYERQIADLVRLYEPRIRNAFLTAMQDIRNRAQMGQLRDALRSGDINAAVNALNIDPAAYARLQAIILEVYSQSGSLTIQSNTWIYPDGTRAVVRYNSLSPLAETYARNLSARLVVGLSTEAQAVARDVIADGYALGRPLDRIARDLVGRIGANGRRTGGVVGLDPQQMQWVRNLREYLSTDPSRALGMKLNPRDLAFIRRIIAESRTLTQSQIDALLRRYENNQLMVRGLRIARTETIGAIEQGKFDAWRQGLEKTGVPEQFLIRTWRHTGRSMIDRVQHMFISGTQVRGLSEPFIMPDGAALRYPHDTELGAGPHQIINCMCRADYKLDKKGLREWYG